MNEKGMGETKREGEKRMFSMYVLATNLSEH